MEEIIRMDPGPSRGDGIWVDRLLPLMDEPGIWFAVFTSDKRKGAETQAYALRSGRVKAPPGVWEFTSRWYVDEKVSRTHARYIGDESDPEVQAWLAAQEANKEVVKVERESPEAIPVPKKKALFENSGYEADVKALAEVETPVIPEVTPEAIAEAIAEIDRDHDTALPPFGQVHDGQTTVVTNNPPESLHPATVELDEDGKPIKVLFAEGGSIEVDDDDDTWDPEAP